MAAGFEDEAAVVASLSLWLRNQELRVEVPGGRQCHVSLGLGLHVLCSCSTFSSVPARRRTPRRRAEGDPKGFVVTPVRRFPGQRRGDWRSREAAGNSAAGIRGGDRRSEPAQQRGRGMECPSYVRFPSGVPTRTHVPVHAPPAPCTQIQGGSAVLAAETVAEVVTNW